MLNRFLRTDIGEIRIFSRDEKKQDDMRHEYQSKYPDKAVYTINAMGITEAIEETVAVAKSRIQNGDVFVQKAPACTIQTQVEAVCELFGGDKKKIKVIGVRHGEKLYETLLTKEECAKAIDLGDFYRVPADNRDMNYEKYFSEGDNRWADIEEFDSDNARRLTLEETKAKIASLEYIQKELAGLSNFVQ